MKVPLHEQYGLTTRSFAPAVPAREDTFTSAQISRVKYPVIVSSIGFINRLFETYCCRNDSLGIKDPQYNSSYFLICVLDKGNIIIVIKRVEVVSENMFAMFLCSDNRLLHDQFP